MSRAVQAHTAGRMARCVDDLEATEDRQDVPIRERRVAVHEWRHRSEDPASRRTPDRVADAGGEVGRIGRMDQDLDPELGQGASAAGVVRMTMRADDPADPIER